MISILKNVNININNFSNKNNSYEIYYKYVKGREHCLLTKQ